MFGQSPFKELQPRFSCEMQGQGSRSHRKLALKVLSIAEEPCFQRAGSLQNGRKSSRSESPSSGSFLVPPWAEPCVCAAAPD